MTAAIKKGSNFNAGKTFWKKAKPPCDTNGCNRCTAETQKCIALQSHLEFMGSLEILPRNVDLQTSSLSKKQRNKRIVSPKLKASQCEVMYHVLGNLDSLNASASFETV